MQSRSNAMQRISIAMHSNAKKSDEEAKTVRNMLEQNRRLMVLGLLVSQQFTASVILLVTSVTFVFLLWRSTRPFSTGQYVGIIPILAGKGLHTVRTWGCPPLLMLLIMLI